MEIRYEGERNAKILALIGEWENLRSEAIAEVAKRFTPQPAGTHAAIEVQPYTAEIRAAARRGRDPEAVRYKLFTREVLRVAEPYNHEIGQLMGMLAPTYILRW